MQQKHQKVSEIGKGENKMKNVVIEHSTKHEGKDRKQKIVDLLPPEKRKG